MRLHPRTRIVQQAHLAISEAVNTVAVEYDITTIELMQVLVGVQSSWLKYALRDERHPDNPDTPADVEDD